MRKAKVTSAPRLSVRVTVDPWRLPSLGSMASHETLGRYPMNALEDARKVKRIGEGKLLGHFFHRYASFAEELRGSSHLQPGHELIGAGARVSSKEP
jgi:hypothetical protein